MSLNLLGIVIVLISSIFIRRALVKRKLEIDRDTITASDFAIIAYHLPDNITEEQLK